MRLSNFLALPVKLLDSAPKTKYILLIIIIGLLVYANSLQNGFVMDDYLQLVENKLVQSTKYLPVTFITGSFDAGSTVQGAYYRAMTMSIFILMHALFGYTAFFYHLLLVSVHIANAILIFLFFKYFFSKKLSLFLSLLFLVHPINTEAVNYVSNLQELLFVFFGLLAFQVMLRRNLTAKHILTIAILVGLSLFSKETGVLFIVVLTLFYLLFKKGNWKSFALYISAPLPLYVLLHKIAVGWGVSGGFPMAKVPFWERLLNTPQVILYYLKTFFFPSTLVVAQTWVIKTPNFQQVYLPLIILVVLAAGVAGFGYSLYKSQKAAFRPYLFFTTWLALGLGMHSQVVPLDQTVADRWFYFPLIGLLGLLGVIMGRVAGIKRREIVFFYLAFALLFALALRTVYRNSDWRSGLILAQKDVQANPDSYSLRNYYGFELSRAGRLEEARVEYEKSISLYPERGALNNLGSVLLKLAKKEGNRELVEKARYSFEQAIASAPEPMSERVYENLAILMDAYDEPTKTKEYLLQALKKFPKNYKLWALLAVAENRLGNTIDARVAVEKAVRFNPECADCVKFLQSLGK